VEWIKRWGLEKLEQWNEMELKYKVIMGVIVGIFVPWMFWNSFLKAKPAPKPEPAAHASATPAGTPLPGMPQQPGSAAPVGSIWGGERILPDSPRNQGLESITARADATEQALKRIQAELDAMNGRGPQAIRPPVQPVAQPASMELPKATAPVAGNPTAPNPLGKDLPPSVSWAAPGASASKGEVQASNDGGADDAAPGPPPEPARPKMVTDSDSGSSDGDKKDSRPDLVLPMYTGIEAVMLSGVNARPSGSDGGSSGGAAGAVRAALNVGAPFVSRVKGVAIMPNSWKAGDLENCFVGGSATAVLSAERAYAIADHISCIFRSGDVYEAPIKAYALDIDGTLGLAGKVVNKQGAMLMQAALTGVAAGLGSALSPTAVPTYSTNSGGSSEQSFTVPSPGYLAGTAVGQGVNHAATELSQFYLNFAKETFPVVEVTAGTRVTWILEEDIVLKKRSNTKENG
jgi:conjugal transfer pilus assembly protein TraB